jgi:hypothetical protein
VCVVCCLICREISLLVKSDGHPNVVRYFLREQRGEFVYLALQLCVMSLKDFVMRLLQSPQFLGSQGQGNGQSNGQGNSVVGPVTVAGYPSIVADEVRQALLQVRMHIFIAF